MVGLIVVGIIVYEVFGYLVEVDLMINLFFKDLIGK